MSIREPVQFLTLEFAMPMSSLPVKFCRSSAESRGVDPLIMANQRRPHCQIEKSLSLQKSRPPGPLQTVNLITKLRQQQDATILTIRTFENSIGRPSKCRRSRSPECVRTSSSSSSTRECPPSANPPTMLGHLPAASFRTNMLMTTKTKDKRKEEELPRDCRAPDRPQEL